MTSKVVTPAMAITARSVIGDRNPRPTDGARGPHQPSATEVEEAASRSASDGQHRQVDERETAGSWPMLNRPDHHPKE